MGLTVVQIVAVQYACALLARLAARVPNRTAGGVAVVGLGLIGVFAAGMVPREAKTPRSLLAVLGFVLLARAFSVWYDRISAPITSYGRFLSFGLLRPYLVYVDRPTACAQQPGREIGRILVATLVVFPAIILGRSLILTTPAGNYWLLNHLIFAAAFIVVMAAAGQALLGLWRLQGLPVRRPINDNILLSRTPADFWRRWNWPVHGWLLRYVYTPAGGRHQHVRATLLVFLVSGLAHELLFFVVIGRATAHQTMFFVLNGLGARARTLRATARQSRRDADPRRDDCIHRDCRVADVRLV